MGAQYDFCGWATRNDLKCADGRTIRRDAFKEQDGQTVPLVWMHQHNEPYNVLGHALLQNRDEGVYTYGVFNDTEAGRNAKELVRNGDVTSLSIYANQLKQNAGNVMHGIIREVSLVVAGANPGATIESVSITHSDDGDEEEAVIYSGVEGLSLSHAEPVEKKDEKPEEPAKKEEKPMANNEKTIKDVFDELTDEQKQVVYFMVGKALEDQGAGEDEDEDEDEEPMKHNVFENDTYDNSLSHADYQGIFADAKRLGSLRDAVANFEETNGEIVHSVYNHNADGTQGTEQTYGVADINYLFPEYKSLNNPPEFIRRKNDWVGAVMNGVHHTPFSRIKSQFADITMDEARAKGYIKGNMKREEVFSLLKRTTDPQTIYKKQKLDRDDIIDITDFDVVAWIKGEMRIMLDEEIARAILIGDGRLNSDDDKISEDHIRPVWTDSDLFTIKKTVNPAATTDDTVKDVIRAVIKARKDYRGSGNITAFMSEDMLADILLLEDGFGHALYADEAAICRKLRCNRIVTVPQFENLTDGDGKTVAIIMVDLKDYNVGADRGGSVNMFDDFDIDYNQQKYLIETRCSGALTKPYSAMVFKIAPAAQGGGGD